ncbi:uncharacterized protein LOC125959476 [Anopheles darlingi]|uniref:uncharacterized protein LOC125959476 n=1 Tax=Anopheles darlingi TaxID=43151 RepID=UPI0021003C14|nr:uncharacterized protein LOC125959476 [Anopheles darlingi]
MLKLFVFYWCILAAYAVKADFEQFYQSAGEEYLVCDLRVRKFNRTASVLNGTIHVLINANDSVTFSTDIFHSPLGNQQFNHYPVKIPTSGVCTFKDHIHQHYPKVAELIVNLPGPGECPITIRQMYVFDQLFPSDFVPAVTRPGLWKLLIKGFLNDVQALEYYLFVKITANEHSLI